MRQVAGAIIIASGVIAAAIAWHGRLLVVRVHDGWAIIDRWSSHIVVCSAIPPEVYRRMTSFPFYDAAQQAELPTGCYATTPADLNDTAKRS